MGVTFGRVMSIGLVEGRGVSVGMFRLCVLYLRTASLGPGYDVLEYRCCPYSGG